MARTIQKFNEEKQMRAMMEKVLKTIGFENKDGQWLITINMEDMDEIAIFAAVEVDDRLYIIDEEYGNEYQLDEFINLYGRFIQ